MKKIIVMLSLGLLVTGTTFAQDAPQKDKKARLENRADRKAHGARQQKLTPEQQAAKQTERLTKELSLNKKQEKKLQALNLKHAQELASVHAKRNTQDGRNEAFKEERKAIHSRWQAELKDILNKEQYAKYEASQKNRAQGHRNMNKGKGFNKEKGQKQFNG